MGGLNDNAELDWEQMDMIADEYTPDFVEIYHEFLDQTPGLFEALEDHLAAQNVQAAANAAHKIKGSSANFGFTGVSEPMARLERQAKESGTITGAWEWLQAARDSFARATSEVREKRAI
jgi:HPt (histidine-containing phosphotransfer) domain-containing protein